MEVLQQKEEVVEEAFLGHQQIRTRIRIQTQIGIFHQIDEMGRVVQ